MFRLSKRYHINPLLLAIFFICLLFFASVVFGYLVEKVKLFEYFDRSIYEFFQFTWHPAWVSSIIVPFNFNFIPIGGAQFLSFLVVIIIISLGYIAYFRRKDFSWAVFACALAGLFDALLVLTIPFVIFRQRPFLSLPNSVSQVASSIWQVFPSYPSGHTRDTALFLTVLAAFLPKKIRVPFIIFVFFIAFSRVFVGAHYPTDVIAAIFIGFLMGEIVLSIVEEVKLIIENKRKLRSKTPSSSS
ncbi:MAG: phosphatase PAP2 family protein [Patescibacteria group bacterium]|jgi:undecaprenyl-diphosphatase